MGWSGVVSRRRGVAGLISGEAGRRIRDGASLEAVASGLLVVNGVRNPLPTSLFGPVLFWYSNCWGGTRYMVLAWVKG